MKITRKIIEIDEELCTGCGECVPDCAEGSLQIVDGKARLVADKLCDGLGACLGSCPTGALRIVERVAEEFDEHAVEIYLAEKDGQEMAAMAPGGGCPSGQIRMIQPATGCEAANAPRVQSAQSALTHWPVQIRLIPASAPFLKNADLLVVADCGAVAYAGLQQEFLAGRVVMMGCPKFDDTALYVQRFADIFRHCAIKSLTVLIMEVPCCGAMTGIIKKAIDLSEVDVRVEVVVISTQGKLLGRKKWEAREGVALGG